MEPGGDLSVRNGEANEAALMLATRRGLTTYLGAQECRP